MISAECPSPRRNIRSNISVLLLFVVVLAVPGAPAQTSVTKHTAIGENLLTATSQQDNPQLHAIASEIERGDYKQAESDARAYLLREPDSSAGHNLLGYVLYRENKPKDSLAEYTSGARFHKPDANDFAVVAMDYVLLADYPAADKWLTEATNLEPRNALYWYYLGRTKYNENRFQEALTAFRRALLLKPRDIRSEYNLGLAFSGLGLTSEAEVAYKAAIAWEKAQARVDPQPYLDLGLLLVQQGKNAQATAYLMTALELDATNPKSHEALGRNYERVGELSKAEDEYKSAIALAPKISALHFELGRIYQKENKSGLAKQEFSLCAALNQSHSTDSAQTPNTGRGQRP
jgi:Flp pilus assembly protein TadD